MNKMNKFMGGDRNPTRLKKTIALSLASGITTVMSVVMQMVSTRVLSKGDLAVYKQTFVVYSTLAPFLLMGIPSGLYYVFVRNEERIRAVVKEATLILCINGILFSALLYFFGGQVIANLFDNPKLARTTVYLGPYALFMMLISMTTPVLVYLERVNLNAKYQALRALLCVSVTVLSIVVFQTAEAGIVGNIVSHVIVSICGILLVLGVLPKDDAKIKSSSIFLLIRVSVPLGVSAMLGTLDTYLDKWIISILMTPEEYAVFSVGAQEIPLIGAVTGAITTVILVDMSRAVKERRMEDALHLFKGAAEKTAMVLIPMMVFLLVVAEPFISFMYTKEYVGAVIVFRIYLLYLPARTVFYGPLMIAMGKSKQILLRSVIEIFANAVLSVLLIKVFASVGASIATIASLYLISIPFNLAVICKEIKIPWYRVLPLKKYLECLFLSIPGAIFTIIGNVIVRINGRGDIVELIVSMFLFTGITAWVYSKYFKISLKNGLRTLLKRR